MLVLVERGLGLARVGVVMAVYGITTAVLELPTGGLADALGRRPVLLLSSFLATLFMALVLLLRGFGGLCAAAFVGGLSRALDSVRSRPGSSTLPGPRTPPSGWIGDSLSVGLSMA